MIKYSLVRSVFKIALASIISLTGCVQSPSSNNSVEAKPTLNATKSNESIQQLPTLEGIDFGKIEYIPAETTSNPLLETAILEQLDGYDPCQDDDPTQLLRYFYNQVDLNNDGNLEVIVYLVGSYTCGTGGCTLLIFESQNSDYKLISSLSLVNNPIVISNQTTEGWHDLILYVSGGGAKANYHILRFNQGEYPTNPSIEPSLPSGSVVTGQAIIANPILFDTPAPVVRSQNCDSDPFALMKTEGFGDLKLDLTAEQILEIVGNPETKGDKVFWGADGFYHQYWYYPEQGITLDMVSETTEDGQKVNSIKLRAPSNFETKRGVSIGDSYDAVQKTYQDVKEKDSYVGNEMFVAGSVYGGLIFYFENNRVVEIFLGAAAE